jgi:hypothetical protein
VNEYFARTLTRNEFTVRRWMILLSLKRFWDPWHWNSTMLSALLRSQMMWKPCP